VISCVYCGGAHALPAEVRQCWARHHGDELAPSTAADEPVNTTPAAPPARPRAAPAGTFAWVRRGPGVLGRNVVVAAGAPAPAEWGGVPRVVLDGGVLANPAPTVRELRAAAAAGEARVFELAGVGFDRAAPPASAVRRPLHELGPGATLWLDELHHLVWGHAVDATGGAVAAPGGPADARLPDGTEVWVDGGPVRYVGPVDGRPVVHAVGFGGRAPIGNTTAADLAPDQLAAVTHAGGTARIVAPAGSGKTRVLTERARHLLTQWRLPAGAVSIVAFNKRAQQEISARASDLPGLQVRTLNAIALAIVNGRPPFAARPGTWRTIDEPDVRRLLGRFVPTPKKLNTDPLAPWLDALSVARLGLVDPAEVEARFGGDVPHFATVCDLYRDALARDQLVDFDEQIVRAIELLLGDPVARAAAQAACRVMLVDEFQDLTPAHLLLVRLLAGPAGAVFAVGDDDQTIYGYNGADPRWLIDFDTWFPGAGDHPLEVNYRCPAGVVEAADRLLRHNRRRVAKTIRAASSAAGGWAATSSDDPVGDTVAAVQAAIGRGAQPTDIAVLTRVNATIAPVQVALHAEGVPVTGGVGLEFFDRTAVRAALAWLRLATSGRFRAGDLGEALRRPARSLHPKIREWAADQPDLGGLRRLAGRLTNEKDSARIGELADDIARLRRQADTGASTARLLATLFDEVGLGGALATLDNGRHGMNRAAQSDDLLALRQLAALHPDPATFEPAMRAALARPGQPSGVALATVHRVKGLEWPEVVVHLADADQYPHRLADDREEERRLFHVAITRARHHVAIVSGSQPSPFVAELTADPPAHLPAHPPPTDAPTRRPAAPASASRRAASDHPLLDRDSVAAVTGLVLVDQGQEWTIVELEPAAALAARNGATRRFALGAKVTTAGGQSGKLGARPGDLAEQHVRAFDLLRLFRRRAADGKPAYTVFDDKTLAEIATSGAADHAALARVRGVGPAKLEQYGAAVLEVLAAASRDPAHSAGA